MPNIFFSLPAGALVLAALALWIDAPLAQWLHQHLSPEQHGFFARLSKIAHAEWYAALALCAYIVSLDALTRPYAQRWCALLERLGRGGLLLLLTMLSGGLITWLLKLTVARARPVMLLENNLYGLGAPFTGAPYNSFPSSHTLVAFATAAALSHLRPRWRAPLLSVACLVALCRVLSLEHFMSDVVAAAAIGMGCAHFWAARILGEQTRWPLRSPWRWHMSGPRGTPASAIT